MIHKKPARRTKVSNVIGKNFSEQETEKQKKYNIWTPENDQMIISNESPKTTSEFERDLKKLNPRLYIHFNPHTPLEEKPFGHVIRFRDPSTKEGYDFVCGVGKGGVNILPAQSKYKHFYNDESRQYETRIEFKGWAAAEEQVIQFLVMRKN